MTGRGRKKRAWEERKIERDRHRGGQGEKKKCIYENSEQTDKKRCIFWGGKGKEKPRKITRETTTRDAEGKNTY